MKKIFTKSFFMSFCLLTLCCLLGGNQAKAKEVIVELSVPKDCNSPYPANCEGTFTFTNNDNVTLDFSHGTSSSFCRTDGSKYIQAYSGGNFTVKLGTGTITKMVLTTSSTSISATLTPDNGQCSKSGKTATWTSDGGNYSSVKFEVSGGSFRLSTLYITYTTGSSGSGGTDPGKVTPKVTFTKESYDVEYGESLDLTSLVSAQHPETSEVVAGTYAFTVTPVGVDGGSTLTGNTFTAGKSAATYTLAATFTPTDTETYAEVADVTATLNVIAPKANLNPEICYKPITSLEQLDCNSQFAFAAANPENSEYCFMLNTWTGSLYNIWTPRKEEVYWGTEETPNRYMVEEYFVSSSSSLAFTLELTEYEGKPCYFIKQGDKYLMGESGNAYLAVAKTSDYGYNADATKWSVEFDEDGYALVKSMVNSEARYLVYNENVGYFKDDVASVAQKQFRIKLLSKSYKLTLSDQANGYGTFVVDNPYVMPKGMKGYTVTSAAEFSLGVEDAYTGGEKVPALTPLLVKGVAGTTYYPVWLNAAATVKEYKGAANLLEYRRDASSKAKTLKEEAVSYYKLAKNSDGVLGFYWGAENGDAFYMSNQTTAYLTVPQGSSSVNGFRLGDAEEDVTAVNGVEAAAAEKVIYNLQGVRMNAAGKLPKGIYVVNGKKMYVK